MRRLGMWLALWACSGPGPVGDAARGAALYRAHCALCHGARGDGRGVRREGLSTPPRDFRDPAWRPRASDVAAAIRRGVRGTAMSAWPALSDGEVADLAAYVLSLGDGS